MSSAKEVLRTLKTSGAKKAKGLPKRAGKRGKGSASHGPVLGLRRERSKKKSLFGVAVPCCGERVMIQATARRGR